MAHNKRSTDSQNEQQSRALGGLRTSLAIFVTDGIKLAKGAKTSKVEGICDSEVWNPESLMKRIFILEEKAKKEENYRGSVYHFVRYPPSLSTAIADKEWWDSYVTCFRPVFASLPRRRLPLIRSSDTDVDAVRARI